MINRQWKVFLLDDHPLVRSWLGQLVEQQNDLSVCGEADSFSMALRCVAMSEPDLAIVDITLPGGSGLELIRTMKKSRPTMRILAFSMHDERIYAERAIRAGANGYLMKCAAADEIVEAIYKVLNGRLALSSTVEQRFAEKFGEGRTPPPALAVEDLSDRELEVFQLLGTGAESRQIARKLKISIKTVQAHCANIKLKLDLANATELLREALRWNEFH